MLGFLFRFYKKTNHKFFSKDKHFAERLRNLMGFTPSNIYIFKLAFYHKSTLHNHAADHSGIYQSNERLEYLGDALLSFVIGEYLFKKYPSANEGFLTKMRSKIVKRKMLNHVAEQMGLDHLMMEFNQTAISQSMLGNALEALLGAIYIEKGFDFSRHFILSRILKQFIDIDQLEFFDDNRLTWTFARFEVILGQRGRQPVLCTADDSTIAVDGNIRLRWPTQPSV